jgi:hypothetical protein
VNPRRNRCAISHHTIVRHATRMGTRTCRNRGEREGRSSRKERCDREDQPGTAANNPQISSSKRDTPSYRTGATEAMGEWERNGGAPSKHNETKHDEPKSETNEAKLTNIRTSQQAHAYRLDCTIENRTQLAKRLSQTIQNH